MAAWRGMKKVTLDTHRRKTHTHTHWAMCTESGSIDFRHYSDREEGQKLSLDFIKRTFHLCNSFWSNLSEGWVSCPLPASCEGTTQWLCGVCVCVIVCEKLCALHTNAVGGDWGEKESGRIPFPTSCAQFQLTSTRTQADRHSLQPVHSSMRVGKVRRGFVFASVHLSEWE